MFCTVLGDTKVCFYIRIWLWLRLQLYKYHRNKFNIYFEREKIILHNLTHFSSLEEKENKCSELCMHYSTYNHPMLRKVRAKHIDIKGHLEDLLELCMWRMGFSPEWLHFSTIQSVPPYISFRAQTLRMMEHDVCFSLPQRFKSWQLFTNEHELLCFLNKTLPSKLVEGTNQKGFCSVGI